MNNSYNDAKGRYEIPKITIETVDQTVVDYFNKKLNIHVDSEKGDRRKVECLWALGERWKITRKSNFKDTNGTLILPIMSVRRTDIDRTPGFGGLGTDVPSIVVKTQIHSKTSNIMNLVKERKLNGYPQSTPPPVSTVLTIPYPDFATVMYEISIWAQYETQMNEILQKIFKNYDFKRVSEFVMQIEYDEKTKKGNGYYLVGFKEANVTPQGNSEDITDQERIIKYTYSIKVPAYLTMDPKDETLSYGKNDQGKNIVYEQQTQNQISIQEEVISLEDFQKKFG